MIIFQSLNNSQNGFFLTFADEAKSIPRKGKMRTWSASEDYILSEQTTKSHDPDKTEHLRGYKSNNTQRNFITKNRQQIHRQY